ncbi:MAG: potassium-transporting ATPase subunit KdpB [Actinobacteria bacterium]|nr:potassium-transporting ATPase subunit KdpB [Actinomycetota bacterium]
MTPADKKQESIFSRKLLWPALLSAFAKLNPVTLWRNPVMFAVEIGGAITALNFVYNIASRKGSDPAWFTGAVSVLLWLTVMFATFAESLAEGRGKARAESLRKSRTEIMAKKLKKADPNSPFEEINANDLRKGDLVLVRVNELIAGDGDIVFGAALVDESAITGESAPVVRESGGDRSAVTGGTRVTATEGVVVQITADPGETFIDKMVSLVEGAKRRKTPNEIALNILLIALTIIFLLVVFNLDSLSGYSVDSAGQGTVVSLVVLIALFVCLAPTTIAALLPAIGIAGMDRLFSRNVMALSGRAIEAAGDVNTLLLDKTGTITLGNREAVAFIPIGGHSEQEVVDAALMASFTDETPEGRSIIVLAKEQYGSRLTELPEHAAPVPFKAETRISGVDLEDHSYRKGAPDSIVKYIEKRGGSVPQELEEQVTAIAKAGSTPLAVTRDSEVLGVINLKDIIKGGIQERFSQLRTMGIKTIMITGDNPLTAAAIAAEANVDDFLAEAKPEDKLKLIRDYQADGYMVAMTGDGTNDAPALAQADVAVAMNTGTQPAREAANIIDLDSNPTKLLDIVEIGKQILMTRGNLTTFSIANDIAKYFAIIPAALVSVYPELATLNLMRLNNPHSAILSAVIFNAIVIPFLIPLALKGTRYRPMPAQKLLVYNLFIYGLGGVVAPFIGIKLIDMLVTFSI